MYEDKIRMKRFELKEKLHFAVQGKEKNDLALLRDETHRTDESFDSKQDRT